MSNQDLYTARWYLATGKPVPSGPPLDSLLDLLATKIGPMMGTVTPSPVPSEPDTNPPVGRRAKVALVIGHNSKQPGAWVLPPLNLSEFAYNSKVAESISKMADGTEIEIKRFFREYSSSGYASEVDRCYRDVNAYAPDLVVEMHFNGGGGNYAMIICAKGSQKGTVAAAAILHSMSEDIGIPIWTNGSPRGIDGRTRSDRGGRSVWASSAPSVMTEPFFGDHSQHAKRVAEIGIDGMAAIYLKAIREAVKALGI